MNLKIFSLIKYNRFLTVKQRRKISWQCKTAAHQNNCEKTDPARKISIIPAINIQRFAL